MAGLLLVAKAGWCAHPCRVIGERVGETGTGGGMRARMAAATRDQITDASLVADAEQDGGGGRRRAVGETGGGVGEGGELQFRYDE